MLRFLQKTSENLKKKITQFWGFQKSFAEIWAFFGQILTKMPS